jgi:hypothetical protein
MADSKRAGQPTAIAAGTRRGALSLFPAAQGGDVTKDLRGYRGGQQRTGIEGRRGPYTPDNGGGAFLAALRENLERFASPTFDDLGIAYDGDGYAILQDGGDVEDINEWLDLSQHTDDEILRLAFARDDH